MTSPLPNEGHTMSKLQYWGFDTYGEYVHGAYGEHLGTADDDAFHDGVGRVFDAFPTVEQVRYYLNGEYLGIIAIFKAVQA